MVRFRLTKCLSILLMNPGDVIYLKIFGQSVVILHSLQAARDLLDKRSSIYSDRPRFVLLSELYASFATSFHIAHLLTRLLQDGLEERLYPHEIVG